MKVYDNLTQLVGNTPLIRLSGISKELECEELIGKVEYFNPLGSVKDRIGIAMIDDAEQKGIIKHGATIIEPTSGNTGIGLAFVCAIRGYKLILTMPETMSIERRKLVKQLGADIVLTEAHLGMQGSIDKAYELQKSTPNSFIPAQFDNHANSEAHKKTTALEIWNDTDGKVDIFVAGVGSGGTITGIAQGLKEKNPNIKIVAVEPFESQVMCGKPAAPHKIQGIGANFVPSIVDMSVIDEVFAVKGDKAIEVAKKIAKTDGLLLGISSGAAIFAASEIAKRPENKGKCIVTLLPDTGERYLSTELFD